MQTSKKIIHIDMDCFYAAIEMLEHPQYRNKPLAVGGKSPRSVLCTANYEARKFGVKAAIPSVMALKLCPSLIILPPRIGYYSEVSKKIFKIFHKYSDLIQPLSLDEAFLDVSHHENAALVAKKIQKEIWETTKLTASAGVSHLKFLAKVASDWKKPNGIFEIPKEITQDFIDELDVKVIPGVGPVTREKLSSMGLQTCMDLKLFGQNQLILHFGKFGKRLWQIANGIDHSQVKNERNVKSVSVERTFSEDLSFESLTPKLPAIAEDFLGRLDRKKSQFPLKSIKTFCLKIKLSNHERKSLEMPVLDLFNDLNDLADHHKLTKAIEAQAETFLSRQELPIRLFGIGVKFHSLENTSSEELPLQLSLF